MRYITNFFKKSENKCLRLDTHAVIALTLPYVINKAKCCTRSVNSDMNTNL